jgi:lipopolysaccharide export system permease protein
MDNSRRRMNSLSRYILRNLVIAAIFVTLALSFAVWLSQALRLLELVAGGNAPVSTFLGLLVLTLPNFLYVILPIALFVATLFVYNKQIQDSEMVVMRAVGLGPWELARPALVVAAITSVIVFLLVNFIAPQAAYKLQSEQDRLQAQFSSALVREGVFSALADGVTVYAQERTRDGELLNILIDDNRKPEVRDTAIAARGVLVEGDNGLRLMLYEGRRLQRFRNQPQINQLSFDRYTVDLQMFQREPAVRWRKRAERPLFQLLAPGDTQRDRDHKTEFWVEAHYRISLPLYVFSFVMTVLACLLSGDFNRRGQARRVAVAIVLAVLIQGVSMALHRLVQRQPDLFALLYFGPLIPVAIAGFVLSGASKPRVLDALFKTPRNWKAAS